MKYSILFLGIILCLHTESSSQEYYTLQQCIERALENNLSVRQSELDVQISEQNYLQSNLSLLPSINASGSQNINAGRSVNPLTYEFTTEQNTSSNVGINGSVTLFSGFQKYNSIRQNKYYVMAGRSNLQQRKDDITLAVVNSFLNLLFAEELVVIRTSQVALAKEKVDRAVFLEQAGSITRGDLLELKAQYATEELNFTNAENSLASAKLDMIQLLELDPSSDFKISNPEADVMSSALEAYDANQVFNQAKEVNPQMKAAMYNEQAAEKGVDLARGSMAPRLSMSGGINSGYSDRLTRIVDVTPGTPTPIGYTETTNETVLQPNFNFVTEPTPYRDQLDQNLSQSIGLTLSIPIFNGWQARSNVKRAKLSYESASLSTQMTENNLQKSIYQLVADHKAAQKRYVAATNSYNSLKEAFSYNEERFKLGMINSVEYNLSKNSMASAQSDMLQAKYQLIFQSKILDYYLGKNLAF